MLWELCASTDAKVLLVQAGGIPALVSLLEPGMVAEADAVIKDVAAKGEVEGEDNDEWMSTMAPRVLEPVTATLSELARSQSANRMAIMRAGGLPLIVQLVCESPFANVVQKATSVLWGLAQESTAIRLKITAASGAIEGLFELLSDGTPEVQKLAAATLVLLCRDEQTRVQLLRVDAVGPLRLLKMKPDSWLRSQADELMSMLECNGEPSATGSALQQPAPHLLASPRVMASRVQSNPAPILEFSAPVIGMPMSPRAFGGAGKLVNTHSGASEVLLARFQAKLEVASSANPEQLWMLQRKKKDSAEYMYESASKLKADQRVLVETEEKTNPRKATIRYVGKVPEIAPGYWVGVTFDGPDGRNDGQINGVQYFKCAGSHGSFLRPDRVKVVEGEVDKGPPPEGEGTTKRTFRKEGSKDRPKLRLPSREVGMKVDKDKARSPTARMGTPKKGGKLSPKGTSSPSPKGTPSSPSPKGTPLSPPGRASSQKQLFPPVSAAAAATAAIAAVLEGGVSSAEAAKDALAAFKGGSGGTKVGKDGAASHETIEDAIAPQGAPAASPTKRNQKTKQKSKRASV